MGRISDAQLVSDGFRYALDPMQGALASGCDPDVEYEWMRPDWSAPTRFRLADQNPALNLWGLFYRPITKNEGE